MIRHGETSWNKQRRLQGQHGADLDSEGVLLAEKTRDGMKEIPLDLCYTSPLIRARDTAEIILRESDNSVQVSFDDRIKEMNFGSFEGMSIRDSQVVRFLKQPVFDHRFPDGESITDVMRRTQEFLKELIARDDGKTYLVSTHGCALRAMLNFLYEDPADYWHGHVPYNCCVNIIDVKDGTAVLTGDDIIYYDREMAIDLYSKQR